jgi:hypothetical protein
MPAWAADVSPRPAQIGPSFEPYGYPLLKRSLTVGESTLNSKRREGSIRPLSRVSQGCASRGFANVTSWCGPIGRMDQLSSVVVSLKER